MRKLLLLTLLFPLLIPAIPAMAQDPEVTITPADTLPKEKKLRQKDFLAIDITMDRWLETPPDIKQRPWSPGVSISLYRSLLFGRSMFSMATGLAISSHNVHSNGQFEESVSGEGYTRLVPLNTPYKKNKISANYVEVPVEVRMTTRGKRPFRIHAGIKGGLLFNIHSKTIDDNGKRKFYNFDNVSPYRYGVYARIGWNYLNLFGYYSLVPLLESGKGDELIPVSAGISITL